MFKINKEFLIILILIAIAVAFGLWFFIFKDGVAFGPESIMNKSSKAMSEVKSVKFQYSQEALVAANAVEESDRKLNCSGMINFPSNAMIECKDVGAESSDEKVIYYNNKIFIPLSLLGESDSDEWVEVTQEDGYKSLELFYASNILSFVSSGGGEISSSETSEFEGNKAHKIVFKIPFSNARGVNDIFDTLVSDKDGGEIIGEILIDESNFLIHSMRLTSKYENKDIMAVSYVFSDFDSDIEITKPENIISEPSLSDQANTKQDVGSVALRNTIRKSDVRQLAYILEKYYESKGEYPESRSLSRTDDVNGDFYKSLVPEFVGSLPVDPLPEKYYYSYTCLGGEQYTIKGVTESENSEKVDYYIYEGPQ